MLTVALLSAAVAVIVFVALLVVVVYAVTSASKAGESVRLPIVSAERFAPLTEYVEAPSTSVRTDFSADTQSIAFSPVAGVPIPNVTVRLLYAF